MNSIAWVYVLLALSSGLEQSPSQTARVEVRLIADSTTWTCESKEVLLVEVRNPNPFPVAVPGPEWGQETMPATLRTPEGDLRLTDGIGCRWGRRVLTTIPPRTSIHLPISTRLCTWPARKQIPFEGELRVSLVADESFVASARDQLSAGTIPVQGTYEARLGCRVVANAEPLGGPFELPGDQAIAKDFQISIAHRLHSALLLGAYESFADQRPENESLRRHIDELRRIEKTIRPEEIRELDSRIPYCTILDDVWYRFALHRYWDGQPAVRRQLLSSLMLERPGSTGALRAAAWLAWPEGFDDPVVSGSWGDVLPPGGPDEEHGPAPDPRSPYERASDSGLDPW